MSPYDAWLYAAQWGSYMTSGDPGACMYGFDERFTMQSEAHRQQCLDWIAGCVLDVEASPDDYEPDDLEQLAALRAAVVVAPCSKESR